MGLALLQEEVGSALHRTGLIDISETQHTTGTTSTTPNDEKEEATSKENLEEWLSLLGDVHSSAETAVSVLNDLLNYDRIESVRHLPWCISLSSA